MEYRETADGRTFHRGTVLHGRQPGWNVSYTTGTGIEGAELNVFRIHPDEPNEWGGKGTVEHHPRYHGLKFPSTDAASGFALSVGLLRPYLSIWSAEGRLLTA